MVLFLCYDGGRNNDEDYSYTTCFCHSCHSPLHCILHFRLFKAAKIATTYVSTLYRQDEMPRNTHERWMLLGM